MKLLLAATALAIAAAEAPLTVSSEDGSTIVEVDAATGNFISISTGADDDSPLVFSSSSTTPFTSFEGCTPTQLLDHQPVTVKADDLGDITVRRLLSCSGFAEDVIYVQAFEKITAAGESRSARGDYTFLRSSCGFSFQLTISCHFSRLNRCSRSPKDRDLYWQSPALHC